MNRRVVAGSANEPLAAAVAHAAGAQLVERRVEREPSGELRASVDSVAGDDVVVVQPTGPPVNDNFLELLSLLRSCRRSRPHRLTAVLPYFGHARHARPNETAEATDARVACDLLAEAGAERIVLVDAHAPGLEAMSPVPVTRLSAAPLLADRVAELRPPRGPGHRLVVVAPELHAVTLADRYGALLRAPVAIIRRSRRSDAEGPPGIIGAISGHVAVVVDDVIDSGATMASALHTIAAAGATPGTIVVATHHIPNPEADRHWADHRIRALLTTDSLPQPATEMAPVSVASLAPLLATAFDTR